MHRSSYPSLAIVLAIPKFSRTRSFGAPARTYFLDLPCALSMSYNKPGSLPSLSCSVILSSLPKCTSEMEPGLCCTHLRWQCFKPSLKMSLGVCVCVCSTVTGSCVYSGTLDIAPQVHAVLLCCSPNKQTLANCSEARNSMCGCTFELQFRTKLKRGAKARRLSWLKVHNGPQWTFGSSQP